MLIGMVGGAGFLFVFPKGAISTLMHHVLHLPGPGSGIALVVGPIVVLLMLVAFQLTQGKGIALLTVLSFSTTVTVLMAIFRIAMNPKGMFCSIWFIMAIAVCGFGAEVTLQLVRKLKPLWRCVLAAVVANLILLLFYWLFIFPQSASWVALENVPILIFVCVAGSLAAGIIAWIVTRWQ